ncbi:MAG: ABC transporter substrate-binding protein [Candidatus Falkowbacteria bacterium]
MAQNSLNLKSKALRAWSLIKARIFSVFRLNKKSDSISAIAGNSKQATIDHKLVYSLNRSRIPTTQQLKYIGTFLNKKEKIVMSVAGTILGIAIIFVGTRFMLRHLENIPAKGGTYTEGVVGSPKYLNPLYSSVNDVDADIVQLVYSSLLKRDTKGVLANDLATNIEISPDAKTYTVSLRQDAKWHNGSKVTAADVIFTFNAIRDPLYKSPLRSSFNGVAIDKVDDFKIIFALREPYAGFKDLLTFGILPQELWYQIPPNGAALAELNLKPVGSGPYKAKTLAKDKSGNIAAYRLEANDNYYGIKPLITDFDFKFYPSYEELISNLQDNKIDGINYLPNRLYAEVAGKTYLNYYKLNLPQSMAVFLNQKNNTNLADKKVRQALAYAINKNDLLNQVLLGNAREINGPILPESFAYTDKVKTYTFDAKKASDLLDAAGWKSIAVTDEIIAQAEKDKTSKDKKISVKAETLLSLGKGNWRNKDGQYFTIKLSGVDAGDGPAVLEAIKKYWEVLGVRVSLNIVDPSLIQGEIMRNHSFEALFYGEMIGADPDVYAFWHSSQSGEFGLNLSNYANKEIDKLLESARAAKTQTERVPIYTKFQELIAEDEPAIFLYSPVYNYIQNKQIKNFTTTAIVVPSDRLADAVDWYINTNKRFFWQKK